MESLNRKEYREKLDAIRNLYHSKVEHYFAVGSDIKHQCDPIAFQLHALVETLITMELYELDCEENGGDNDQ